MRSEPVIFLSLVFTCIACGSDSFILSKVIDGNTIELSNGTTIDLAGVSNTSGNRMILEKLVGTEIYLFDENKDPITDLSQHANELFLTDVNGKTLNDILAEESDGLAKHEEEELTIQNESASIPTTNKTLSQLYKELKPAVFLIYSSNKTKTFQGSGFFIGPGGLAVSNYHVFEGTIKGEEIIRTFKGVDYRISKVLTINADHDYIIFTVQDNSGRDFPFLTVAQEDPEIGDECFAIGNPLGLESTLSKGIISQIRDNGARIQTTTEITHGSSGGPLFNMNGEVIGITSSGVGEANLNFAINIKTLNIP